MRRSARPVATGGRKVRVRVESSAPPPRRARIKIVHKEGSLEVEGVLVSAYRRADTYVAYYDLNARYRDPVRQVLDQVTDVILIGDTELPAG